MKKIRFGAALILLVVCSAAGMAQSPSFQTYTNPVIPGDHPDPTLTRVGNDFYTSGSAFNPTPVIYHSTDLVHWEVIAQPVKASWRGYGDQPGGGAWGGHLVYYSNKYWDFFSRAGSMYYVQASRPEGPWSDPVKVRNPPQLPFTLGYDNSVFIDDDGKWYLVVKNGQPNNAIVELDKDGQPAGVIYNLNWLNPAPGFPYSWAEGPVMWKHNGYYYYSFAKNVTGGQWVMRSNRLTADSSAWSKPVPLYNEKDPLIKSAIFRNPNHTSPVITLDDGTSWAFTQSYARDEWRGQARQGLLSRIRYINGMPVADYPVERVFSAPRLPDSGIPWMVPKSDFFDSAQLNPEWSFLGYTPENTFSLQECKGWLKLSPKAGKPNTVIKIEGEHNYSLITRVDFQAKTRQAEAGLRILRSDEKRWVKLYKTVNAAGKDVICFSDSLNTYEAASPGKIAWLKIVRMNHEVSGYYSSNGNAWTKIGNDIHTVFIDTLSANWIGTRIGLYVQKESACFDLFIYRDAYSPILAECPANQFGTSVTKAGHISSLDSISNNDWALYAGVEFGGNSDYPGKAGAFEVTASGVQSGGVIEVWLDSVGTGKKIGECAIKATGDWNRFRTFKARVEPVKGRHDVYLRFKGPVGDRLFMLKQITFTAEPENRDYYSENKAY